MQNYIKKKRNQTKLILGTIYTFYVFIFTSNLNQMKILEQICQEINLVLY